MPDNSVHKTKPKPKIQTNKPTNKKIIKKKPATNNSTTNVKTKLTNNGTYYLSIRKKVLSLYEIYEIDEINRILLDDKRMNMVQLNIFIEKIIKLGKTIKNDRNYHACVIEQMACFLIYPKSKSDKQILWDKIINYIQMCKITNSYDLIKKYDIIHSLMMSQDIIILFDADTKNIMSCVKTLKQNKNISDILIGLYDNNIVRIIFENDDFYEIFFNNYKTVNIALLEKYFPIDRTIKTIFNILAQPVTEIQYPIFSEDELLLLSKYMFTYAPNDKILKIIKYYKITIINEYIDYYTYNENWSMTMFEYLMQNGANPNINTILYVVKKYMRNGSKSNMVFELLKNTIS